MCDFARALHGNLLIDQPNSSSLSSIRKSLFALCLAVSSHTGLLIASFTRAWIFRPLRWFRQSAIEAGPGAERLLQSI